MNCTTCRFSRPAITDDGTTPVLQCQRFPHQIVVADNEIVSLFPQVDESQWCGEWALA